MLESFRPQQGAPSAGTRARERGGAGRVRPTQGATRGGGSAHERRSARGSSGPHRPHSSVVQSAFQRRATRTSEPMASSRRLCCYTLLAICLAIASCSAAAVDSGRDVSRQLVLRFPAVPARPARVSVCLAAGPMPARGRMLLRIAHRAIEKLPPSRAVFQMLRGGGVKHWTNAPSVVTWFRCAPAPLRLPSGPVNEGEGETGAPSN